MASEGSRSAHYLPGFTGIVLFILVVYVPTGLTAQAGQTDSTGAEWVVDPGKPGPSLPPVGRSLFDFLVTKKTGNERVYDIPFPYKALIKRLDQALKKDPEKSNSEHSSVKQVLVPLGRSLARNIARPDFFRFPRVVAAVDTDQVYDASSGGIYFKDRIYIGYGEKANVLEVISYNEAAARFEFQIVTDYRPGGDPKVFYASREVCSSCHQNGALIFSRQQWDETNANPEIAALLRQQNRDFYGVSVERGVDVPFAIDEATDRANYFSVYQKLWQELCVTDVSASEGNGASNKRHAVRCRADILNYVLQYRLSGETGFENQSEYYQNTVAKRLLSGWKRKWPKGLLIADPDIPNRNPLMLLAKSDYLPAASDAIGSDAAGVLNNMLANNDVSKEFEPLMPRAPLTTWTATKTNIKSFIQGLSGFLSGSDIRRIDEYLATRAVKNTKNLIDYDLSCSVSAVKEKNDQLKSRFNCRSINDEKIQLKGSALSRNNRFVSGQISKLTIEGTTYYDVILASKKSAGKKRTYPNSFRLNKGGTGMRLVSGDAIKGIKLNWTLSYTKNAAEARAVLSVNRDYSQVTAALDKMVQDTVKGHSDTLSAKPFRRANVMAALTSGMNMPVIDWCCTNDAGFPPAELENNKGQSTVNDVTVQSARPELSPFYRNCSLCHRTKQIMPPNFLQGNLKTVEKNIEHCAERIFFRLSMWQLEKTDRQKSPMPPFTALNSLGIEESRWKYSDELSQLTHYVTKVLEKQTGKPPTIEEFMATGFDNLRACLP